MLSFLGGYLDGLMEARGIRRKTLRRKKLVICNSLIFSQSNMGVNYTTKNDEGSIFKFSEHSEIDLVGKVIADFATRPNHRLDTGIEAPLIDLLVEREIKRDRIIESSFGTYKSPLSLKWRLIMVKRIRNKAFVTREAEELLTGMIGYLDGFSGCRQ